MKIKFVKKFNKFFLIPPKLKQIIKFNANTNMIKDIKIGMY